MDSSSFASILIDGDEDDCSRISGLWVGIRDAGP
jgi:hypothetical protein